MTAYSAKPCTAFAGSTLLAAGPLLHVALAVKHWPGPGSDPVLVFDDATGRVLDIDLRGNDADIIARLSLQDVTSPVSDAEPDDAEPRGRGRPKLGVVGREVTLLPRHWDWLAAQPGGASVALRKLIDEARRAGASQQQIRLRQEAAYRFMSALAGDLPGYEEATRALFADDRSRFSAYSAGWPNAVAAYALRLGFAP